MHDMILKWFRKEGAAPIDPVPPPSMPLPAALAPESLDAIRFLQQPGGPDLLSELIDTYFTSSAPLLERIREAVAGENPQELMKAAHSLKSSSAYLGALSLTELCKEMETLGRNGTLTGTGELLGKVEAEYAGVCVALRAVRQGTNR
jgi:HPt (histidine-containing phosphotransfer) domain-containing protein